MRAHFAPAFPDRYFACRKGSCGLIRRRVGPRRRAPVSVPPVLAHCRSPMLLGARGSLLMDRRSGGSYSAAPRAMAQRAPYSRTPASPGPAPPWGAEADWPRGGSCAANACAPGPPALVMAFLWPSRLVDALQSLLGCAALRDSFLCRACSAGSFFSGLGTSEIGWRAVGAALRAQGFPFSLTCHFACDVDADCRNVLTGLGLGHVFGDIMALIAAVVDETWHVTRKERSIMCAPVRASSQCYQCGVTCPCGPVQVTVSGSPCQDWSSAGNMLGLGGKRAHVLLAWIRWHIVWEPPLIIHENVTRFDLQVLESRLGEVYWVYSVVCNPGDVGWTCVRRPRLYVALVHKAKLDVCCNPAWLFWEVCRHIGGGQPLQVSDLLVATPAEVCHEAWLVGRERRRQLRQQCSAAGAAERIALAVGAAGMEPERLLSPGERLRLAAYLRRWKQKDWGEASGCSNLVLNLGDNPEAGWLSWSAPKEWGGHFVIPTLRRAWTVQWLPALRRWLTRSERLVLMGFPAYPELAQLYGLPGACQISWRTSKKAVGNAMHVANVGVWQAVVAACVRPVQHGPVIE